VDADLAVLQIIRFLNDHAARIESNETSFHLFQILDLQSDMVQSKFHVHFAEAWPFFEKGQIIVAVRDGNISLGGAAEFLGAKKAAVKLREFFRLVCKIGNVAKRCHGNPPGSVWSIGVMGCRHSI
jgi:hypothetical protein